MKLKLLTLLFTLGLFAFGADVSAQMEKGHGFEMEDSDEKRLKVQATTLLSTVCGYVKDLAGAPKDCETACANILNPDLSQLADLSCCMGAVIKENLLPWGAPYYIKLASYPICSGVACKADTSKILPMICGAINCNSGLDNVTNCLNSQGMSCSKDFPASRCTFSHEKK